jgi:hypothetical protein
VNIAKKFIIKNDYLYSSNSNIDDKDIFQIGKNIIGEKNNSVVNNYIKLDDL